MAAIGLKMTCNNPKNLFCFVCGVYTKSHHKRSIMTKPLIDAYEAYFVQGRTAKRNYVHGPPSVCNDCNNALLRWANGLVRRPELAFDVPMIWSEPRNHQTDCYFCLTDPGRRPVGYYDVASHYPNNLNSAVKPRLMSKNAVGLGNGLVCTVNRRGRSMGAIMDAPAASTQLPRVLNRVDSKPVAMNAPAQRNDSRVRLLRQAGPVLVAGMKRKSSLDPPSANTYDVTKVRLRSSEPSIVLEQSEKRLPSNSVAAASPPTPGRTHQPAKPAATSVPMQPKIARVFSLQGKIPAYDDFSSSPTALLRAINGHIEMPLTIEIDDDDDDEEEEVQVKQQMKQEQDETIPDQEKQSDEQETETSHQAQEHAEELPEEVPLEEENEQQQQQQFQQPVEEDRKPPMAAAAEFINIHSLPSASSTGSSKMVVVKMAPPQKPNGAPSSASTGVSVMPTAAPTTTTNNTTTATNTAPTVTRLFPVGPGRAPHLITQSELILLLRDLELTREKSAILIDRLKRWNLLAAQLVKPTRGRNSISGPAPEQPKPPAHPVVRRVSTLAALSTMGSVTIKQGARTPVVLTTPTGVQRNGRQSFIRLASAAVQSNTVTTSNNNNGKVTVTANGVPVLRQQLQTVGGSRSPVKFKVISPSKMLSSPVEQLQPITANNN